jgi:hypothetical protein
MIQRFVRTFPDVTLPVISPAILLQTIVNLKPLSLTEDVFVRSLRRDDDVIQVQTLQSAAVPHRGLAPRAIDQDVPHRFGSSGEKVTAIVPGMISIANHLQIRLVNQGRRLQRLVRRLQGHFGCSQPTQFFIHEWQQFLGGFRVAAPNRLK